jgi:GMP synthase (glutamine-hydrolysing)
MRKVIVFKHVSQENLGALKPVLSEEAFRIRYVNFDREPDASPSMEKYQGLIVLGGWMGVYEADQYPHIKLECQLIEAALKRDLPVLGICLGAQILAHTLGAPVRKHREKEAGWREVKLTAAGRADALLGHFRESERIFQMHGDTFEIPAGAEHLAHSDVCEAQAFRYGEKAYGLQFHLEADQEMIRRFLKVPENRAELEGFAGKHAVEDIERDTEKYLPRSADLSRETFHRFLKLFGLPARPVSRSTHGKRR